MKKLMAVLALGVAIAGCGVAPEEEPVPANNAGSASSDLGEPAAGTSEAARPELRINQGPWYCLPGEDVYCAGVPPVCKCVPSTVTVK
jgi:hypothetical protein